MKSWYMTEKKEVHMGWFFNKKKNTEAQKAAEEKAAVKSGGAVEVQNSGSDAPALMKAAIAAAYDDQQDVQRILDILRLLSEGIYWVPMNIILSQEDQEQFLNASKGDSVSLKSAARMKPDFLKASDGNLFFPAFTSREETDEAYRNRFSWVQLPGKQIINAAEADSSLTGVVINGFSQPFTVTRELIAFIQQAPVAQHTIEKGAVVTFERLGDSCKGLRRAMAEIISWKHLVKKAFFAKMYVDFKPESYCLVVDGNIEDPQSMFRDINEKIQKANPDLPVDYVMYPSMAEQLRACGIEPFYVKDRSSEIREQVPMEPTRLFFITIYTDREGWNLGASFDFEKAADSHYDISGEEAVKLAEKLRADLKSSETNLINLVHDYLGSQLKYPEDLEGDVCHMLNKFGIEYQAFHYD